MYAHVYAPPFPFADNATQALKIVSFEIATQLNSRPKSGSLRTRMLRDTAIWFPSVPSSELDLNDDTWIREDPRYTYPVYQPMIWVHFGGSRGSLLQHLVAVEISPYSHVTFHYNLPGTPFRTERLGRPGAYFRAPVRPRTARSREDRVVAINGPGGERIESVEFIRRTPRSRLEDHKDMERSQIFDQYGSIRFLKVGLIP